MRDSNTKHGARQFPRLTLENVPRQYRLLSQILRTKLAKQNWICWRCLSRGVNGREATPQEPRARTKEIGDTEGVLSRRQEQSKGLRVEQALYGGAERVRTAASQFCRLLPYHLGTAPRGGGIIVASFSGTQYKTDLTANRAALPCEGPPTSLTCALYFTNRAG